jgi:RNA polymerase sigma factor (sigma-70 family)
MNGTTKVLENERAVIAQAKEEPRAFAPIYEHYFPRVYSYVLYRVEDPDVAADVTAQTFERAYAKLDRYQPERAAFSTWLFTIATNAIRNHRRWHWLRSWVPLDSLSEQRDASPTPEQSVAQQELINHLLRAVAALPEREREILALKFGARLTNREIADFKGLTASNVGVILYRAVRTLRATMEVDYEHE